MAMHWFGIDLFYPNMLPRYSIATEFHALPDTWTFFTYVYRGGSVPQVLLEKAEEYLPPDMGFLIKFVKVNLQFCLYM